MVRLVAQLTRSRPEMKCIMKALTRQTKILTEFKQMDSIVGDILMDARRILSDPTLKSPSHGPLWGGGDLIPGAR